MPIISTLDQLIYTVLFLVALMVMARVQRRLDRTRSSTGIESVKVRLLGLLCGDQLGQRLRREERVTAADVLENLRVNATSTRWLTLGLRVRVVLLSLLVGYLGAGGSLLRPETILVVFIGQALRPVEWSASVGHRLPPADAWRVKFLVVGATTLLVWSITELIASDVDDRLFWMGWVALAAVLLRVAHLGGPGHGSRKFSLVGWTLIGIGQFGSDHMPGNVGVTLAMMTCFAAMFAGWGAYREERAEIA